MYILCLFSACIILHESSTVSYTVCSVNVLTLTTNSSCFLFIQNISVSVTSAFILVIQSRLLSSLWTFMMKPSIFRWTIVMSLHSDVDIINCRMTNSDTRLWLVKIWSRAVRYNWVLKHTTRKPRPPERQFNITVQFWKLMSHAAWLCKM